MNVSGIGLVQDYSEDVGIHLLQGLFHFLEIPLAGCAGLYDEDRPVKLDFPDGTGLRRQLNVVAARWTEVEEGHVLHLWVQLPPGAVEESNSNSELDLE